MKYLLPILTCALLLSCGQTKTKRQPKKLDVQSGTISEASNTRLNDDTIQFLSREMKYDASSGDSINSLIINQNYIASINEPVKAALGYVATFIGNDCWWDGEPKEDRSNLDCKIVSALGLGYQCSAKHLGFLRKCFSTDDKVLLELEKSNCPTTPYSATIQNTFNEIKLTVSSDSIIVFFEATAVNMREQSNWHWSETDYFKLTGNDLSLIKKVKSEVQLETFEISEE